MPLAHDLATLQRLREDLWRRLAAPPDQLLIAEGDGEGGIQPIATLTDERRLVTLVLADGTRAPGWMTCRFMGGKPTYWCWLPASGLAPERQEKTSSGLAPERQAENRPVCVVPVGWEERG